MILSESLTAASKLSIPAFWLLAFTVRAIALAAFRVVTLSLASFRVVPDSLTDTDAFSSKSDSAPLIGVAFSSPVGCPGSTGVPVPLSYTKLVPSTVSFLSTIATSLGVVKSSICQMYDFLPAASLIATAPVSPDSRVFTSL